MQRVKIYNDLLHLTGEWMNADMLNRETEDRHPLSFYLSLFFLLFFKGGWGLTSPPPPSGSATAYSVTGSKVNMNWWLGFWFLTPLSTIFQLYRGVSLIVGEDRRPAVSHWQTLYELITIDDFKWKLLLTTSPYKG